MDSKQKIENLPEKFKKWTILTRVDFKDIEDNLQKLEVECKNVLGFINLTDSLDEATKKIVEQFFVCAVKEILATKKVIRITEKFYADFLSWLGMLRITKFIIIITKHYYRNSTLLTQRVSLFFNTRGEK